MSQHRPNEDQRFLGINLPMYIIRIFKRAGINSGDALKEIYRREPFAIFSLRGVGNKTRALIIDELGTPISTQNQKCRVCGCDQDHACKGGCFWVYDDLCSQCYEKMMSFSIKKRKVQLIGDVIQDGFYDLETIAEDIQTQEMAEGFIYGYTAAKDYIDLSDDSVDSDSELEAFGISIWQDDEVITEFFFTEVTT